MTRNAAHDRAPTAAPDPTGHRAPRSVGAAASPKGATVRTQPAALRLYSDAYSVFVGLMKFVLPVAALVLVALVMFWPQFTRQGKNIAQSIGSTLSPEDIENLQIVRPRYTGLDDANRPFLLTADLARQASPGSDLVSLSAPRADITLHDGAWLALTAASGSYYQKDKRLHLSGEVSLFHDGGYSIVTDEARIDLTAGKAEGDRPVSGQGPLGNLRSQGFRVFEKGDIVIFTGPARLSINTEDEGLKRFLQGSAEPSAGKGGL